MFNKFFTTQGDQKQLDEAEHEEKVTSIRLPPSLLTLLGQDITHVKIKARHHAHGVVYACNKTHAGNSLVAFLPQGSRNARVAVGSIKYIYYKGKTVYFAIQRYWPYNGSMPDPFALYRIDYKFDAKVYATALPEELEEVHVDWVVTQCARFRIDEHHTVIVTLYKVSVLRLFSFLC